MDLSVIDTIRFEPPRPFDKNVTEIVIHKFEFEPQTWIFSILTCFFEWYMFPLSNPGRFLGFSPEVSNFWRFPGFTKPKRQNLHDAQYFDHHAPNPCPPTLLKCFFLFFSFSVVETYGESWRPGDSFSFYERNQVETSERVRIFEMGVKFQIVSTFGEQAISYEKYRYVTCGELFIFTYHNFWSFSTCIVVIFSIWSFLFQQFTPCTDVIKSFPLVTAHPTSRVPSRTTVIDVRVIPSHHRSPTQSEETTGKLRPHAPRTKGSLGMETRARCRPLVVGSVVN